MLQNSLDKKNDELQNSHREKRQLQEENVILEKVNSIQEQFQNFQGFVKGEWRGLCEFYLSLKNDTLSFQDLVEEKIQSETVSLSGDVHAVSFIRNAL